MDLKELSHKSNKELTTRHPWELARFDVACNLIEKNIGINKVKIVFDIGCGDTFFIESLCEKYHGVIFYGIDIAFTDEYIIKKNEELKTKNIFLFKDLDDALMHCNQEISLILLMDVIEHIKDDQFFLNTLKTKTHITTNTNILITVPAYQNLFCQHDVFLEHYRRYNSLGLKFMLKNCGYTTFQIGYFFMSLLLIRSINVFFEKMFRKSNSKTTGLSKWGGSPLKSKILKFFLIFDFSITKLFKHKLPGLSVFVLCRKSV